MQLDSAGIKSGAVATGKGVVKKSFRAFLGITSAIIIIIWLLLLIPKLAQAHGAGEKFHVLFWEFGVPILSADNAIYYSFEDASNNGLHLLSKPDKVWCGYWFCPSWMKYWSETINFLLRIIGSLWFMFTIIYVFYWVFSVITLSSMGKNLLMAIMLFALLEMMFSPYVFQEQHLGEPMPPFSETWVHAMPLKGIFAIGAYLLHADWYFYDKAQSKVYKNLNITWSNQTTS